MRQQICQITCLLLNFRFVVTNSLCSRCRRTGIKRHIHGDSRCCLCFQFQATGIFCNLCAGCSKTNIHSDFTYGSIIIPTRQTPSCTANDRCLKVRSINIHFCTGRRKDNSKIANHIAITIITCGCITRNFISGETNRLKSGIDDMIHCLVFLNSDVIHSIVHIRLSTRRSPQVRSHIRI